MKAVVITKYGPPEVLRVKEVEKPALKENEVLIRIHPTAVVATDSMFRKGDLVIGRLFTGLTKPTRPIPGGVLAGEVEAVGSQVIQFKVGDRVFAACAST